MEKVRTDDILWCDGLVAESPTHLGTIASPFSLKLINIFLAIFVLLYLTNCSANKDFPENPITTITTEIPMRNSSYFFKIQSENELSIPISIKYNELTKCYSNYLTITINNKEYLFEFDLSQPETIIYNSFIKKFNPDMFINADTSYFINQLSIGDITCRNIKVKYFQSSIDPVSYDGIIGGDFFSSAKNIYISYSKGHIILSRDTSDLSESPLSFRNLYYIPFFNIDIENINMKGIIFFSSPYSLIYNNELLSKYSTIPKEFFLSQSNVSSKLHTISQIENLNFKIKSLEGYLNFYSISDKSSYENYIASLENKDKNPFFYDISLGLDFLMNYDITISYKDSKIWFEEAL